MKTKLFLQMAISLSIFATQLLHGADYSNVTEETIVTDVLDYSGDIHITETGKLILENYAEFSGALSMDAGAKLYMVHFAQSVGDRDMSLVFGGAKVTTSGTYFHIYEGLNVEATKTGAILTPNPDHDYPSYVCNFETDGDILVENFIVNSSCLTVLGKNVAVNNITFDMTSYTSCSDWDYAIPPSLSITDNISTLHFSSIAGITAEESLSGNLIFELSNDDFTNILATNELHLQLFGALPLMDNLIDFSIDIKNKETGESLGSNFSSYEKLDRNTYQFVWQLSVPEPSTATLSLLALAGLAARRRRV